jgi:hypothetical protein
VRLNLNRCLLPEVRNPVLALPSFHRLASLDLEAKLCLAALLREIGNQAAQKAQTSWKKNKAPMAAYWKAVSVYARHIARALARSA